MRKSYQILLVCSFLFTGKAIAQPISWMGETKPYRWQFGLGWNVVDDDGRGFCQTFDYKEVWNVPVFPSRVMADRYLKKGMSIELAGTFNQYKASKRINDTTGLSGNFLAIDANFKYSFYNMIGTTWFDPYVSAGVGITNRTVYSSPLLLHSQLNGGVNFWLFKGFGIQLQASGKLALTGGEFLGKNDYLQYTAGIVYRTGGFNGKDDFQKKQYRWTKKKEKYKSNKKGG